MTPEEFVKAWQNIDLSERASYQRHFSDLCTMLGVPAPRDVDDRGYIYQFEYGVKKDSGSQGFADVYYEYHFAVEYKAPGGHANLDAAYQQLQQYRGNLKNPPLLVVTDIDRWIIRTNFTDTVDEKYIFTHEEVPQKLDLLRTMFTDPRKLRPRTTTDDLTKAAAERFFRIAQEIEKADEVYQTKTGSERIARFLSKLVFCLFAEDVNLLPPGPKGEDGIFTEIVSLVQRKKDKFISNIGALFRAMAKPDGEVMAQDIPYFNGSLFDDVQVEPLELEALTELERASQLNWAAVNPTIFGTLFERVLDATKRSQLGAHYTGTQDIELVIKPVLMTPLLREWEATRAAAAPIREKYDATTDPRQRQKHQRDLLMLRDKMLDKVQSTRVLDPACGSGNFLYVALRNLKDLEKAIIYDPLFVDLPRPALLVDPTQLYGIELDPIAHALASIVVWIGYIQWHYENGIPQSSTPILKDMSHNILSMDAILTVAPKNLTPNPSPLHGEGLTNAAAQTPPLYEVERGSGGEVEMQREPGGEVENTPPQPLPIAQGDPTPKSPPQTWGGAIEPDWPEVDVIIGNPPFLGDKKMRAELGDEYVNALRKLYAGRVPGGADLVCYWFEKARAHIEQGKAKRAGLLATNSIRQAANREVLKRIKQSGDIFMAVADREWILEGASVRISIVGFDDGTETEKTFSTDGSDFTPVKNIAPDLTASVDITIAKPLAENVNLSFIGVQKSGAFDITYEQAKIFLGATNISEKLNSNVIRPTANAQDVVGKWSNTWIIDFNQMSEDEAKQYEQPYAYVLENVKPERMQNRRARTAQNWWLHGENRPGMRQAMKNLSRYIAVPFTSKHRVFVWMDLEILPSNLLVAIARDDDYFFGVLHSKIHEVWSLRMGTSLGPTPRYTPNTTFETFPFPFVPGKEDVTDARYQAIAAAAKQLHEERSAWLNPHPPTPAPLRREGEMKDRTLTNLYNALNVFRGKETMSVKAAAGDFAPRLDTLHTALDAAVCAAYGWDVSILQDEEAILRELLALNLAR